MTIYVPSQPSWKRSLAGFLDFVLTVSVFGSLLYLAFGSQPRAPVTRPDAPTELFSLGPWPTLILVVSIVAYFVVLGRTGGTVFQRLFGMKRLV